MKKLLFCLLLCVVPLAARPPLPKPFLKLSRDTLFYPALPPTIGGTQFKNQGTFIGQINNGLEIFNCTTGMDCDFTGSTFTIKVASGAGTVTSFSSGNLSPLFHASVATSTTTPALTYSLDTQAANLFFAGPLSGGVAQPTWRAIDQLDLPQLADVDGFDDPSLFHLVDDGSIFRYLNSYHRSDLASTSYAGSYMGSDSGYYLSASLDGETIGALGIAPATSFMSAGAYYVQIDTSLKRMIAPRLSFDGGNAHPTDTNFVLGSGWGSTAYVDAIVGSDSSFKFRVVAQGIGILSSPTIVYTFVDGGWGGNYPTGTCQVTGGTGAWAPILFTNGIATNTTLPMIYSGLPVTGLEYIIQCHVFGRNN